MRHNDQRQNVPRGFAGDFDPMHTLSLFYPLNRRTWINRSSRLLGIISIFTCRWRRAGFSVCPQYSVPEEMYHCKVCISMSVMNKVQCLFASEPFIPQKPRPFHVVFFIEIDVCIKRCCTDDHMNEKQINRQNEVCKCRYSKGRN